VKGDESLLLGDEKGVFCGSARRYVELPETSFEKRSFGYFIRKWVQ